MRGFAQSEKNLEDFSLSPFSALLCSLCLYVSVSVSLSCCLLLSLSVSVCLCLSLCLSPLYSSLILFSSLSLLSLIFPCPSSVPRPLSLMLSLLPLHLAPSPLSLCLSHAHHHGWTLSQPRSWIHWSTVPIRVSDTPVRPKEHPENWSASWE